MIGSPLLPLLFHVSPSISVKIVTGLDTRPAIEKKKRACVLLSDAFAFVNRNVCLGVARDASSCLCLVPADIVQLDGGPWQCVCVPYRRSIARCSRMCMHTPFGRGVLWIRDLPHALAGSSPNAARREKGIEGIF